MKKIRKKKSRNAAKQFPYKEEEEILANIRWFRKFPLEKRFEIAERETKDIKILQGLALKNAKWRKQPA